MSKWEVSFRPLVVEADNEEEALEAAVDLVRDGHLEEDTVEWWDD